MRGDKKFRGRGREEGLFVVCGLVRFRSMALVNGGKGSGAGTQLSVY